MKNGNILYRTKKIFALLIAMGLVILTPVKTWAITIDGLAYFIGTTTDYRYIADVTSAFDVRGKINGSATYNFQTTYKNGGYTIDFEVDGNNRSLQRITNGATVTNNGVSLQVVAETIPTGLDVHLNISNPAGNGEHTYRIAMTADIQLGSNDYAAIYKDGYAGLVVTQDDATKADDYGAKVFIDFFPNVNTSWLGDYKERVSNKYTNGTVSAYTAADAVDTAAAWSWNGSLADGESTIITTRYRLTETNTVIVSFYNLEGQLVEEKEALLGGALVLPDLSTPEEGLLHVWCEDVEDDSTCYSGGSSIIVDAEDLAFHEALLPDPDYIPTSTISFYDQSDELVEAREVPVGEETTLPELTEPEEGFLHLWCEDKEDLTTCLEGNTTITVTEDQAFHEALLPDPDYTAPVIPDPTEPTPIEDPSDPNDTPGEDKSTDDSVVENDTATYEIESIVYSNNADGPIVLENSTEEPEESELVVPLSQPADTHDDTVSEPLEKTNPLGVTKKENGKGATGLWRILFPCLSVLLSIFFFIILFKRKKDDEDEEEEVAQNK